MCFHVEVNANKKKLEKVYDASFAPEIEFEPAYHLNGFAHPHLPVITNENDSAFKLLQWGLIPFWTKHEEQAKQIQNRTLNAKAETITKKPSFRAAVKSRQCIIPVTGFFEWQTLNNKKFPYYIYPKAQTFFTLAGIYENWTNKETGEILSTFSIITTAANPLMEKIHNKKKRMPVILPKEQEKHWLDEDIALNEKLKLLQPFDDEAMDAYTISKLITKRGANTNVPEVKEKVTYDEC